MVTLSQEARSCGLEHSADGKAIAKRVSPTGPLPRRLRGPAAARPSNRQLVPACSRRRTPYSPANSSLRCSTPPLSARADARPFGAAPRPPGAPGAYATLTLASRAAFDLVVDDTGLVLGANAPLNKCNLGDPRYDRHDLWSLRHETLASVPWRRSWRLEGFGLTGFMTEAQLSKTCPYGTYACADGVVSLAEPLCSTAY
jgi:hypothetical protein